MSPFPTRPIDDAGPLKGKTPPILISVAEIPGSSAANAGPLKSKARAATVFHFINIAHPPKTRTFPRHVVSGRDYSSFLELVKHLDHRPSASHRQASLARAETYE